LSFVNYRHVLKESKTKDTTFSFYGSILAMLSIMYKVFDDFYSLGKAHC